MLFRSGWGGAPSAVGGGAGRGCCRCLLRSVGAAGLGVRVPPSRPRKVLGGFAPAPPLRPVLRLGGMDAAAVARCKAWQAKKADAGLAGLTWPKKHGGQEMSPIMQVLARPFSLEQIYGMFPYFGNKFASGSVECRVVSVTPGSATLAMRFADRTLRQFGPFRRRCTYLVCQSAQGIFSAVRRACTGFRRRP